MIDRITQAISCDGDGQADEDEVPLVFFAVVPDAFIDRIEAPSLPTDDTPSSLASHDRWSF